ncbi:hypothetical protein ZWY2020_041913 [Hordeum vulgare]|nr:hypothetical protein ZWY2020_041913 [Hordeum vulgare]
MSKMMEIAARYANGEEEDRIRSGKHKAVADGDGNNNRRQKQKAPSTPLAEAAVFTNAKFKGKGKAQYTPKKKQFRNTILDQPCPIHMKMDEEGNTIFPKHTTRQCRLLIQGFSEGQPSEKENEQDDEDKEDPFPQVHATLMIFADVESKSRLKLMNRELKMPGPKGVITVTGNRQQAEECLQQGSRIADQQMAILEMDEYKKIADPADLMRSKKPASESAFQVAGDTKKVSIHPMDDAAAPTNISTTLDPK